MRGIREGDSRRYSGGCRESVGKIAKLKLVEPEKI